MLEGLKQAGVSEKVILGALVDDRDPGKVDTVDKLKDLMSSKALAGFSVESKTLAAEQKIVAIAGKNEAPVLEGRGDTDVRPAVDGSIVIVLATASDKETEALSHHLRYVLTTKPAKGSLGPIPADGLIGG